MKGMRGERVAFTNETVNSGVSLESDKFGEVELMKQH